jgi:transposase
MEILSKSTIEQHILPNLSIGSRGTECETAFLIEIVSAILYRLKTGCQWRQLPVKQVFSKKALTWQGVYYHFSEWVKSDRRSGWFLDEGLDKYSIFKSKAFGPILYSA